MIAIPTYIDRVKAGHIVPGAKWTVVQESPTTTVIDGHWGFGFHVNTKAMIVGFAAGGGNDIIARVFGQKLSESLGQPVIVENKPGGGAIVATDYVAKAAPDGYTLLLSASGIAINPVLYDKLPYAVSDFVPVSQIAAFPLIMIVSANSPIKSVADLIVHAKANPDTTNYAISSATFQLVTELFKQKTGAPMQVIPYKSANESVLAVISGQVTTAIADAGPVVQQVKSGTARALAVATSTRIDDLPDVPTLKEAGADVEAVLWSGIFVPKGTPPAIVKKLEGEFMAGCDPIREPRCGEPPATSPP